MELLRNVVGTLQEAATDPGHRGPLIGVVRGDGTFDLPLPPQVCGYLDAEAVVLVAAEQAGGGVGSIGVPCAMHDLPGGWKEAHEALQWIAQPLRRALTRPHVEDTDSL